MRRHLPPARTWIVLRAHRLQQHFEGSHSQHQAQRAVAIVRINPVCSSMEKQPHCCGDCFVSRTRNLKVNFILAFELNLAVIQLSREIHRAVQADQRVSGKTGVFLVFGGVGFGKLHARLDGHSVGPRSLNVSGASNSNYTEVSRALLGSA